ncbi:MAG: hypothetical protein COU46_00820 [Candidatus Niyogibacteria bacterium CG10_big_fil_rev_8_21_14_0_10_42_19]|uniref:30S ribosomal protein S21 n=1 Tax=Candidatus Niyogibacteria bacterium CG10_big_fil_rev_8_21_14_0_10_42_19 TaxID=1974725 RepID=A0A2H0TG64_9BACT|nr:MAG: hypothetical protein COU46_00820 [Candidatus Niyogibacteria bacterium CG10_big_fil_rev_8_21_14_0_10_42_19]
MNEGKKPVIEVKRRESETPMSLMRRFSRKIQQSSVLRHARSIQFHNRPDSKVKLKNRTIKKIEKYKKNKLLKKLGKIICSRKK